MQIHLEMLIYPAVNACSLNSKLAFNAQPMQYLMEGAQHGTEKIDFVLRPEGGG